MPWHFRLVERQRGYMFLDPANARTTVQLGAPAAKKKSYLVHVPGKAWERRFLRPNNNPVEK